VSPNDSYPQHVVTAVIVAHDGAAWLPQVIQALLEQTRPVQRVVAVDTGSRDRSGSVLSGLLGQSVVFGMDRGTGYSAAVRRALQHRAANVNVPAGQGAAGMPGGDRVEWLWLLHDDSEPAPDALEQLLRGAAETRSAAVLGPKVKDWSDRRVILETGVTIDTVGRRITGIEPREVDQGQHDGDRDCLAVGSAGMLVRRDVWDSVGGFDTGMSLFREDVDFCWRVHQAGYRVRVITDAVVYHLEASARRRRPISVARRPRQLDRRNAMLTLAGNLPAGPMLVSAAGNIAVSLLRAAFFLIAKRLAAALDELAAVGNVLGHPLKLLAMRRARARGRRAAYARLRRDLPSGQSMRKIAEFTSAALSKSAQVDTAGSHHATDDPEEADFLLTDTGLVQRILTSPGVLLFLGLTVVSLVAERSLLGSGPLSGGALVPAWGGASGLWHEYVQGFHPVGVGSTSSTPPYLAVIAVLATVLGGKPWLAVDVILLGCVPLAGVSAFLAARRVTRSVPLRVWAAASYALLPVAMGAIAAGRIGTAVVFVLVPAIGVLAGRMLTQPARRARRAAWAAGLTVALAAAFVPLAWAVTLVAALALLAARPAMWRNLAIIAVVPPLLLLPWTLQVAAHPSTLLLEAGLQQPGLAQHDLAARSLMLLSPGGPGLPPVWVTAGIVAVALAALLVSRRRALMMAGWGVALSGLVVAIAVSRAVITPPDGGSAVPAWPGVALLIAAAGLLLAAVTAGEAIPALAPGAVRAFGGGGRQARAGRAGTGARRGPRPLRGAGAVILVGVACSAPALAAASWVISGVRGPVAPSPGAIVPAVVLAAEANGLQQRTLVLGTSSGQVTYSLQRGASPSLGDSDLTPAPPAQQALNTAVADLVAPDGGEAVDQGQALAQFDIAFVLLPSPVNQSLARVLDGVAGLRPLSATSAFYLWRVTEPAAQVRVVEPDGTVVAVPSGPAGVSGARAPAAGGTIELAEPAGGWSASLNGKLLTPAASPAGAWAEAYQLPAGGGVLQIGRSQTGRDLVLILQLLLVVAVAALALPGARAAADEGGPAAFGARAAAGFRGTAGSRAAGGARVASGTQPPGAAGDDDGYPASAGPPPPREAARAGEGGAPPGGRRARVRSSRGQRADRDAGPAPRRGRRPVPQAEPDAGPARRPQPTGAFPAAGRSGPHAAWPGGEPRRDADQSGSHAAWPDGEPPRGAGPSGPYAAWPGGDPRQPAAPPGAAPGAWPGDELAGGPPGPRSGWPSDELAGPVSPPRSPSGSWPPPDEQEFWPAGDQADWSPPSQPPDWPSGASEVLDPLPPSVGRHGRRAHEDEETPEPRWPVPEHDSGGDAW
jgi:GT2 family glycosyltransferase